MHIAFRRLMAFGRIDKRINVKFLTTIPIEAKCGYNQLSQFYVTEISSVNGGNKHSFQLRLCT